MDSSNHSSLAERLKTEARRLGFELVGIAYAAPADGFDQLQDWLARGFAGEMAYMHRQNEARRHPKSILPDVKSVVMVGLNYNPSTISREPAASAGVAPIGKFKSALAVGSRLNGKVARYARGADYHDVLREKLDRLLAWVRDEIPEANGRGVVDTAPLLERDFGRRAGMGWFGKNTMLINKRLGSYFLLGALLLDTELELDAPFTPNHCGTCTACLDACPTHAFVAPGQLDSRRCISYLTIELRGPIPEELRPALGDWAFGCDICQEVCPWNRKAPADSEARLQPRPELEALDLIEVLGMSDEDFRRRFRHTALWRSKRRGLLRNAAIVLGNIGDRSAIPPLEKAISDPEPLVREAAQWAIEAIARRADLSSVRSL
ncbi:MAG: tRNA epoxyqueuosine(34) reductase QueG [Planctomycetes bacterium]|nr:tRNA epoxyqueuosine(34) reductase QueG [Planctomycetota bacterium]